MTNLVINKYEVALFPRDFYASDLNTLLLELKTINAFKNGVNTLIPIPPDVPREIPRLILRSKDQSIGCNISFDKANLFWLNTKEKDDYSQTIDTIKKLTNQVGSVLMKHTPTKKVWRVGFIKEYYLESEATALIKGKTLVENLGNNLKDYLLQFTYKLENMTIHNNCNEVVIINSNAIKLTDKKKVVMLTHDINTVPTPPIDWDLNQIADFISEANDNSKPEELKARFFI